MPWFLRGSTVTQYDFDGSELDSVPYDPDVPLALSRTHRYPDPAHTSHARIDDETADYTVWRSPYKIYYDDKPFAAIPHFISNPDLPVSGILDYDELDNELYVLCPRPLVIRIPLLPGRLYQTTSDLPSLNAIQSTDLWTLGISRTSQERGYLPIDKPSPSRANQDDRAAYVENFSVHPIPPLLGRSLIPSHMEYISVSRVPDSQSRYVFDFMSRDGGHIAFICTRYHNPDATFQRFRVLSFQPDPALRHDFRSKRLGVCIAI